nr:MAG TPA: hypothetical protein [Caudoviricetes sp.]
MRLTRGGGEVFKTSMLLVHLQPCGIVTYQACK